LPKVRKNYHELLKKYQKLSLDILQFSIIETMKRLQGEYFKALKILEARLPETASSDSNIIQIPKKNPD